jgi:hypothetical protein
VLQHKFVTGLPVGQVARFDPLPYVEHIVDNVVAVLVRRVGERLVLRFDGRRNVIQRDENRTRRTRRRLASQ